MICAEIGYITVFGIRLFSVVAAEVLFRFCLPSTTRQTGNGAIGIRCKVSARCDRVLSFLPGNCFVVLEGRIEDDLRQSIDQAYSFIRRKRSSLFSSIYLEKDH